MELLETKLASDVAAGIDVWVDAIVAAVAADVPSMVAGDAAADLATASSRALLEEFVSTLTRSDGLGEARAPSPALGFARHLARTEASLAGLLRSYRLGQELLFDRAAELAGNQDGAGLRRVGLLTFRFVDAVVSEVTAAFEQERESFLRGSALRRERLVGSLLMGELHTVAEVETTLGWRMTGTHVAVVVWSDNAMNDALSAQMGAVLRWLGDEGGLTMPGAAGELYGWTISASATGPPPAALRESLAASGARAAVGEPARGLDGFIASRRQADAARRMARYFPDESIVRHRNVALLHLLLADHRAASAFAVQELGGLAEEPHAVLRATAKAYLEHRCDASATATDLGIHRNTVMRRVDRAARLLGRPVEERLAETHAALLVTDAVPEVRR